MEDIKTVEFKDEKLKSVEEIGKRLSEMQEKMIYGINQALNTTAEKLDNSAESMHKTAEFFREKDADSLKQDLNGFVKKHPGQTLLAALVVGFLFSKVINNK